MPGKWYPLTIPAQKNFRQYLEDYLREKEKKYQDNVSLAWDRLKKDYGGPSDLVWFINHIADEWFAKDLELLDHLDKKGCPEEKSYEKVQSFAKVVIFRLWGLG